MTMPMMNIRHVVVFMFLGGMFMLVRVDFLSIVHARVMGHRACDYVHGIKPYAYANVHAVH